MGTGPFLIRSQPFPAVPASRDARRSQSRARHCKTKALGGSSNPAPPNRHCSLNENSVPKVHSAPKLCHPSVTWCCHLHSDPLPLEQRAGACKEQLCAAPVAKGTGGTGATSCCRDSLSQVAFWHFSGLFCDPGYILDSATANSLPNPSLILPSPPVLHCVTETCSHYGLFPTWLLPFQNTIFHFQKASGWPRPHLTKACQSAFFQCILEHRPRMELPASCRKASKPLGPSKEKSIRHRPSQQPGRKTEGEGRGEKCSSPDCAKLNKNNKRGGKKKF